MTKVTSQALQKVGKGTTEKMTYCHLAIMISDMTHTSTGWPKKLAHFCMP